MMHPEILELRVEELKRITAAQALATAALTLEAAESAHQLPPHAAIVLYGQVEWLVPPEALV